MTGRRFPRILVTLALVALAACGGRARVAAENDAAVNRELDRLGATLRKLEASQANPSLREMGKAAHAKLDAARRGRSRELRLYRLRDACIGVEMLAFLQSRAADGAGLGPLTALWQRERVQVLAPLPALRGRLLERALAEAAANRARRLYEASVPYARVSEPGAGLYYLAEAEGNARFRDFVLSLKPERDEAAPSAAALRKGVDDTDRRLLARFAAEPSSRALIPLSASLKEARELLDRGSTAGATLLLLETNLRPEAAWEVTGGGSPPHDSIEMLLTSLRREGDERTREAATRKGRPLYASLYAAAVPVRAAAAPVTVTLVRWPYT